MATGRRAFLIGGIGATAVGAGTYAWLRRAGYPVDEEPSARRASVRPRETALQHAPFDIRARAALASLMDELIPGDPALGLPSAAEASVLAHVEHAAGAPGLRPVRDDLLKLARHLDLLAERTSARRFAALDGEARNRIVAEVAADTTPRGSFLPARALELALRIALEGYLGHPFHGGNRDGKVWRALGVSMPLERSPFGHGGGHHR